MIRFLRPGSFAAHLLAYSLSEAAAKGSRLLVVIAVARTMDAGAIGLAAAAMAASDIVKSLTENGVGQRVIAARDEDLAATTRTAHRIFWAWCLGLFALQVAAGGAIWAMTGDVMLFALIAVLAGEYLFMPAGLVQCALAMREGKMKQTAAIAGGQVVAANVASALLALIFPGPIALVLPRLMAAPVWLVAMRRLRPWRPDRSATAAPLRPFLAYGWAVLGVEVVKALRLQADKLVIGALLGTEMLGLYFMAFNAGLGLATSFSQAFATVLFPHLVTAPDRAAALRRSLILSVSIIAPAVMLQALAAPYYVPVLFGDGWSGIEDVVSILCLAAIPGVIWSAAAQWLRAHDKPQVEFLATLAMTAALIANTIVLAPYGLTAIAMGYLVVALVTQIGAALPAIGPALVTSRRMELA
ncbi:polysaccharide transporter, PST family [Pseudooceanicola antarcticus]|uniref:Polysaccharide biosynthesis protein n=1 Tax=Pseudooceanicola antarcticus TaxID=1247613 RepID=A0A285IK03_9RHOB|nr:oligosaccharide flippase family protein [Pseudooceanicola antarcticus]PJE28790.1 polysaccharide biosynthesis protein [Pseudooceanicola antarcticus]SNY48233.1 polysaccharide transporter, PST family [Pseudooceanicola antarcticus]